MHRRNFLKAIWYSCLSAAGAVWAFGCASGPKKVAIPIGPGAGQDPGRLAESGRLMRRAIASGAGHVQQVGVSRQGGRRVRFEGPKPCQSPSKDLTICSYNDTVKCKTWHVCTSGQFTHNCQTEVHCQPTLTFSQCNTGQVGVVHHCSPGVAVAAP